MLPSININELSLKAHFAPSEIRHMMPIYRPTILENLFVIFRYFVSHGYPKNIIPIPDPSLRLTPVSICPVYVQSQILWHYTFDEDSENLKNTLTLGASLVNYLYE